MPLDDGSGRYIVLDGANRITAIQSLGVPHILAQVVDSDDPGFNIASWKMKTKLEFFLPLFILIFAVPACSVITGESEGTEPPPTAATPTPDRATLPPPTREPLATRGRAPEFGVILISEGDVLNVRSGPGVDNGVIGTLDPHATGITMTGVRQKVGNSIWVEVDTPFGTTGWVNAHFLTETVAKDAFCNDPRIAALVDKFVAAIQARDGDALSQVVSPEHGLSMRVSWWNPTATFSSQNQIHKIFIDPTLYDWGIQDGSGLPIQGTFSDEVLPWMDDVLDGEFSWHCNDLENGSGASAGFILWPFEYQNINYIALYRAAAPGDELNWRTWAVGITYHQGQPYISFLVQYHWEI